MLYLDPSKLTRLRTVNPALISLTEVTSGTFRKAYTDAQIDGTEQIAPSSFASLFS